jgi:hypothetical protein
MNSDSTKQGPYEYDRNSELIGMVYVSREWLDEHRKSGIGLKTISIWAGLGLTVWLSLVFAGVVLWKVWR